MYNVYSLQLPENVTHLVIEILHCQVLYSFILRLYTI